MELLSCCSVSTLSPPFNKKKGAFITERHLGHASHLSPVTGPPCCSSTLPSRCYYSLGRFTMPDKKAQGFSSAVADEGRLGRLAHRLFLKMGFQRSKWQKPAFCLWPVGGAKCGCKKAKNGWLSIWKMALNFHLSELVLNQK